MNSNSLAGINHDSFEQAQLINYTSLSQLSAEIKLWLEARQTSRSIIYFITLTFEEMALRCIRFGYSDSTEHLLQVKVLITPTDVTLRLIDDASPIIPPLSGNPLRAAIRTSAGRRHWHDAGPDTRSRNLLCPSEHEERQHLPKKTSSVNITAGSRAAAWPRQRANRVGGDR